MTRIAPKLFFLLLVARVIPAAYATPALLCKVSQRPSLGKKAAAGSFLKSTPRVESVLNNVGVISKTAIFPEFLDSHETSPAALQLSRWIKIEFGDEAAMQRAYSGLLELKDVEYVGENRSFSLDFVPNDPRLGEQWALENIKATEAWDIERGRSDILVAIIDTGIDYQHPDLAENVWVNEAEDLNGNGLLDQADLNGLDDDGNGFIDDVVGWDFTDAPNYPDGGDYLVRDNDPMDEQGHGTGVAGIVAAVADNSIGIAGIANMGRVMALRAFTSGGNGEEDDVASAILYAIKNGARVINMSWGDVFVSRVIDDIVRYAASKGIVMVASAGNAATDQVHYPSGFEGTISVGATTQDNNLSSFSNFGPTVDIVAPGSEILTLAPNGSYTQSSGTSFSTPFVSAAAALLLSQHPEFGPDIVRANLVKSSRDLGASGWDPSFASGLLDLESLLTNQSYSLVEIQDPFLDKGISAGPVEISGSAWSPTFDHYLLSYGKGDNPDNWTDIYQGLRPVLEGHLYTWDTLPAEEGPYTLQLQVINRDGSRDRDFVRIFLDKTRPQISNVQLVPMLDGDKHSLLIQFDTDDLSEGSVFFRPINTSVDFDEALLTFRTNKQKYNLTQDQVFGRIDIKLQARNQAGLSTLDDNDSIYYNADLSMPPLDVTKFSPTGAPLPTGFLLPASYDFNGNGLPEVIIGSRQNGAVSIVRFFEYSPEGMIQVYAMKVPLIPRDIGDSDGDGLWELLCGYGFNSYLYEANEIGQFPQRLVQSWEGDGATQYWASRITDLDKDGKGEIVLRTVTQDPNLNDQFALFEVRDEANYVKVAEFPNPTPGDNQNGVPHSETGDFDGDGSTEILFGDSDGDLYIYENVGDDRYALIWQYSMPLLDTIDFIVAGDFDGDRVDEFAAGSHTDPNLNTEHEYDARHWLYRIFDADQQGNYVPVAEYRLFGFESPKDFDSGISAGDIDLDGDDEIFISAFPDFYLIDYLPSGYDVVYYHNDVESNGVTLLDADNNGENEFFLGKTNGIYWFRQVGMNKAPAVPAGLRVVPLDGSHLRLEWRAVKGADHYIIQRGTFETNMINYDISLSPTYIDSNVYQGKYYYYSVAAVDFDREPMVSTASPVVRAVPGARPRLLKAVGEDLKSVRLYFTKPMNGTAKNATRYLVNQGVGRASSAVIDASGQQIVVNFANELPTAKELLISCSGLADIFNTPLDTTANSAPFAVSQPAAVPYLVAGRMIRDSQLELTFSEPMDQSGLIDSRHYRVENLGQIADIQTYKPYDRAILRFDGGATFGALGRPVNIRVNNLKSAKGVAVQAGRGDFLQLLFSRNNLNHVFTFPNPFRPGLGSENITFANLTREAEIEIFTSRGIKIRSLKETDGDGGIEWNLLTERGERVASGIYLYRVRSGKQTVMGKLAIVR